MSNQNRGQADLICKQIVNDIIQNTVIVKRDKKSIKPGSDDQGIKKLSTKVDIKTGSNYQEIKGGDGVGDDVGEKEAGDAAGGKTGGVGVRKVKMKLYLKENCECKICGAVSNNISDYKKHLSRKHSKFAISVATNHHFKSNKKPQKLHKCASCERNFFFLETWKTHTENCHIDMTSINDKCQMCNNVFNTSEMETHVQSNHSKTSNHNIVKN